MTLYEFPIEMSMTITVSDNSEPSAREQVRNMSTESLLDWTDGLRITIGIAWEKENRTTRALDALADALPPLSDVLAAVRETEGDPMPTALHEARRDLQNALTLSRIANPRDSRRKGGEERLMNEFDTMTYDGFRNRLLSLHCIDGHLLPEFSANEQKEFVRNPVEYFLRTDAAQRRLIWQEIEARQ